MFEDEHGVHAGLQFFTSFPLIVLIFLGWDIRYPFELGISSFLKK